MNDIQNDLEEFFFELATDYIYREISISVFYRKTTELGITRERAKEIWALAKSGLEEME